MRYIGKLWNTFHDALLKNTSPKAVELVAVIISVIVVLITLKTSTESGGSKEFIVPVRGKKSKKLDPLFQLFEHHLFNRSYDDSEAFAKEIAEDYMAYLDSTWAHLPFHTRTNVLKDLQTEAHEMLVKKMYGCVRPADYVNFGQVTRVKKGEELEPIEFESPSLNEENPKKN